MAGVVSTIVECIPPLNRGLYKGKCGKVGVIGGCLEYTGAPYFAGISALLTGADLVHIFCAEQAAVPIKSYSPELIVHPVFVESSSDNGTERALSVRAAVAKVEPWLNRLDVLVIGCGMGRGALMFESAVEIIRIAREMNLPILVDGDASRLPIEFENVVDGYERCVMTPNFMEFMRLCAHYGVLEAEGLRSDALADPRVDHSVVQSCAMRLASMMRGVMIVVKGAVDLITDGRCMLLVPNASSPRRCGGQGDILAGIMAVFVMWSLKADGHPAVVPPLMLGAYAGCFVTRDCSATAFDTHRRSMTASSVLSVIGERMQALFPVVIDQKQDAERKRKDASHGSPLRPFSSPLRGVVGSPPK